MSERRFVFDTNTLVSAVLFKTSVPRRAFDLARSLGVVMLSPETFAEAQRVFQYARFDQYVTARAREEFLEEVSDQALWLADPAPLQACRDPNDDKFLALALAGGVEVVVSGDQDLLVLHPFCGIPILTTGDFLNQNQKAL